MKNKHSSLHSNKRQLTITCYAMLALPIIGFLVFTLYPQLWTFKWAFYNYNQIPSQTRFVGLDNFKKFLFYDTKYWRYWWQTIRFAIIKIPIEMTIALTLASLINQQRLKGKGFFRAFFYTPVVISGVVVSVIFSNLFGYFGVINELLLKLGFIGENIDWFATGFGATVVLVVASIWHTFGTNVLYFVAALNNVPKDCYESAKLDGANAFTVFFRITLPLIVPVFRIILLLSIIGTLGTGEFVITLTGGGPSGATQTINSYIVNTFVPGFAEITPNIGYGCAISIVTSILFAIIALFYNKLSAKKADIY